ncbi:MAG: type II toxin-antitoxin system VapC family toxin [Spirochaetia bacterium]
MDRSVLLDTHVWVWLMEGRADVNPEAVQLMEQAGEESFLRVSVISAWEVGMLEARGRLRFDIPCEEWLEHAFGMPGLSLMPLTPSICVRCSRLPGVFHGDPADRLIVATARELGAVLLTRDELILQYAALGHLQVLAA